MDVAQTDDNTVITLSNSEARDLRVFLQMENQFSDQFIDQLIDALLTVERQRRDSPAER